MCCKHIEKILTSSDTVVFKPISKLVPIAILLLFLYSHRHKYKINFNRDGTQYEIFTLGLVLFD